MRDYECAHQREVRVKEAMWYTDCMPCLLGIEAAGLNDDDPDIDSWLPFEGDN